MKRQGKDTSPNPLLNGHLADGHFSPLGCEVWAEAVGHRLSLILARKKIEEESSNKLSRKDFGAGPAAPRKGTLSSDTMNRNPAVSQSTGAPQTGRQDRRNGLDSDANLGPMNVPEFAQLLVGDIHDAAGDREA